MNNNLQEISTSDLVVELKARHTAIAEENYLKHFFLAVLTYNLDFYQSHKPTNNDCFVSKACYTALQSLESEKIRRKKAVNNEK